MKHRPAPPPPPDPSRDCGTDVYSSDLTDLKSVATFIWKIFLILLVVAWVSLGVVMTVRPRDSQLEFKQWVIGGWAIATAVGLGWPLRSGRPS